MARRLQSKKDELVQEVAAKNGFVPGAIVFVKETFVQKWKIDSIFENLGEGWATLDGVDAGCGSWPLRELTLEVETPGAVIEELPEEEEKKTEVEGEPVQVEQENETEADKPEEGNIEGNEEATTTPLVRVEGPGLVSEQLPQENTEVAKSVRAKNWRAF